MQSEPASGRGTLWRPRIGLVAGPLLFALVLSFPTPAELSVEAHRAGAVAVLMAVWWITEAIPIAATALIPLAFFPLLSVLAMPDTARRYADPNIFLFMGGFMIAMAMQKWQLHRRIALHVIAFIGGGLRQLMAGFMLATAFLSMWVSNTATTVMMLPIGMAVVSQMDSESREGKIQGFGLVLMLGIAYAASVGGVATLIGTPPNVIFAGQAVSLIPELGEIGFVRWFLFALPLALGFLGIVWFYLAFVVLKVRGGTTARREVIREELAAMGRWSFGEKAVLTVFLLTALAWITRADLKIADHVLPGWTTLLGLEGIHDGTIAIAAAIILFMTPVNLRKMEFLLDWDWAKRIPWGVLILFGGGFALAESFRKTGLADWMGGAFVALEGYPVVAIVLVICLGVTFLTEVTSNTATATMLMPVLAAASAALEVHPYLLMIPATVSASFAFMLPVATPPNAIVFGSGRVSIPQMAKAGFALNVLGAFWITFMVFTLAVPIFGLRGWGS